ncbi:putative FAD synthase [Arachis hypogaea]|nr:putative FAD synthase [Arachis hypogaea]
MEIDRAIRECSDRRLQTKYNNATYVIQRALALYSIEEVAFSFNGGKDSTVLLHLLRAGYFLHKEGQNSANGDLKDFPIRTIYFETPSAFPEINSFTYDTAATLVKLSLPYTFDYSLNCNCSVDNMEKRYFLLSDNLFLSSYGLQIDTICTDFKSGLEALLKEKPIRAIFLGVRIGDPTAVGQEQFSPSSPGWPAFMRVNPILDWSYRDVWAFLLTCKVNYCSLYDQGYTSIGSIYDTVPNSLLSISDSSDKFKPAYLLADGRLERAGRAKRLSSSNCGQRPVDSNGLSSLDLHKNSMLTASVIAVGDEFLFGTVEDQLGPNLCRKLHSVGWSVLRLSVVHSNIDSVAEEVEQKKSSDMVFIYGGVGPLHSDVTIAGIAKAFGVRLAPDEEFEEYLRHIIGDQCIGDRNEMAQLPEGITELLHHDKLSVPLIKCQNVIVLTATNVSELEKEWNCLIELTESNDLLTLLEPYVSKQVMTNLSDVEIAQPLSKLCLEFPDLHIGCYRTTRYGSLVVSLKGKDQERLELAMKSLEKKFQPGTFKEMN